MLHAASRAFCAAWFSSRVCRQTSAPAWLAPSPSAPLNPKHSQPSHPHHAHPAKSEAPTAARLSPTRHKSPRERPGRGSIQLGLAEQGFDYAAALDVAAGQSATPEQRLQALMEGIALAQAVNDEHMLHELLRQLDDHAAEVASDALRDAP